VGRFRISVLRAAWWALRGTRRTGTLHSYVLFTGDERRGIRGELESFQVAP